MDKVAILFSKLGTLVGMIWSFISFFFRLPFYNPVWTLLTVTITLCYYKRNEIKTYPVYFALQNLVHETLQMVTRQTLDADSELNWSQTSVTHLIGQYCCHHLDSLRLSSGFYIGSSNVRQSWVIGCSAQKTKSLILRGELKATLEIDIRHLRFHGDWRGFVRLQGSFLIYHGRETGLDVQFSRISLQSRVTEDVPNIDEILTNALQRGFQLPSMAYLQRVMPNLVNQHSVNSSQSSTTSNDPQAKLRSPQQVPQQVLNTEPSYRAEHDAVIKRSPRSRPVKPKRNNRPSKQGGPAEDDELEIRVKCFALYHQWDDIIPRIVAKCDSVSKVFVASQSGTMNHVWEFVKTDPFVVSLAKSSSMLEVSLEVKHGAKWIEVAQGTLDLKPVKTTVLSIELSDKEEPICELSLQFRHLSRYGKSGKNEVLFDDRVRYSPMDLSPSSRRDVFPMSSKRSSVAFTESSVDIGNYSEGVEDGRVTSMEVEAGSFRSGSDAATTLSNEPFSTETDRSLKKQLTVDNQLVREICRVHVTAKKDELGADGIVSRVVTPSPVPSLQRQRTPTITESTHLQEDDDDERFFDDDTEDQPSNAFVRGGGRHTFPNQSRPRSGTRLTDSLPDVREPGRESTNSHFQTPDQHKSRKSTKGQKDMTRPKSAVFSDDSEEPVIKKAKSKKSIVQFFSRFRRSRTPSQRSTASTPAPPRRMVVDGDGR